ncbi:MAG: serine/threonine-protein kinase, partial [Planctomycetota bacterium]|nr:serine/threonine-protein kinase [Planctomycetota bacterium]
MNTSICPECRRTVPQNAPDGICPDCLLVQGLERLPNSAAFAVTTPQGGRPVVPQAADISRYFPQLDVLELLGQGGMGAVYKARQTKLDRMVAVKIIRAETTGDPAFAERFMREARTLAKLNHSGIVAVHDFGEIAAPEFAAASSSQQSPSTLFYFIMEYVDGANLRQLMQAGQLSPELAVNIVPQICDALQFAHDEGVVHRDIKPENILLDSRGRVKIADFGLAKIAGHTTDDWTLTGTHQVMGTPRYMAPEQLAGSRTIDHRADIYSLGVVFYEMLTGTIPVGHFAPPSHKSKVDVRLDEVVLRAMASEPERRFQAARDLRSRVEQISSSSMKPAAGARAAVSSSHETGFSTIIDREVLGAWRLVSGNSDHTAEQTGALPAILMLLLCAIGGLGTFLPWFDVTFVKNPVSAAASSGVARIADHHEYRFCQATETETDADTAAVAPAFDGIPWNPDDLFQCTGIDLKTGMMAAVVFGSLGLLLLLMPNRYQISVPANSAAAFLAMLTLLTTLVARIE